MAECHPVGFQWVVEAQRRGAQRDPRRSALHAHERDRRPARADPGRERHRVPRRAHPPRARERAVVRGIRARLHQRGAIIGEEFADTEDLDGLFSGWDPERRAYDTASWQYEGELASGAAASSGEQAHGAHGGAAQGDAASRTRRCSIPRCVFQILQAPLLPLHAGGGRAGVRRAARALPRGRGRAVRRTPAASARPRSCTRSAGPSTPSACSTSAPPRSCSCCSATSAGPAAGIMALRGHASIQGSTDIPTLYNILPGYLPMPSAVARRPRSRATSRRNTPRTGYWGRAAAYVVSLLKAWWGDAADADNDCCFDWPAAHRRRPLHLPDDARHARRQGEGLLPAGREPGGRVRARQAAPARDGPARLAGRARLPGDRERVVLARRARDRDPASCAPQDIATEVFLLPAAAHTEKDGTFTNTQRLLQWHHKAVEPPGDCRSELWFMYHLGRRIREKLAGSSEERDRPLLDLTWDYPDERAARRSRRRGGAARDQRLRRRTGSRCRPTRSCAPTARLPAGAGSTAAASRAASTRPRAGAPGRSRPPSRPSGAGRGRSTAACSTTAPRPIPPGARGRSASATCGGTPRAGRWTGDGRAGLQGRHGAGVRAAAGRAAPRTRCAATRRS